MNTTWRDQLADRMPADWAREIDIYETQTQLKKQGKGDDKVFAETRLRRGTYGQRYDNGQRHDGVTTRSLAYPSGTLLKGPETMWDAPGMQRIKIPFGGINPEQMMVLAELADAAAQRNSDVALDEAALLMAARFVQVAGGVSGRKPMRLRISCGFSTTSWPSMVTRPEVGRSTQPRTFSVVDLPAPFSPRKPMTSPRSIWKRRFRMAAWRP